MKIINYIIFSLAAITITGCLDDPDCNRQTTNFVNIKFYKSSNNEADTISVKSVKAVDTDSIFIKKTTKISGIALPLNPKDTQSTYIFDSELGIDTLILTYNINSRLVSEDCGIEMVFSELNYSRNDFESIRVVNRTLVETITEDVKIFN